MSHEKAKNKASSVRRPYFGINGEGCPDGTVPIKRVTKKGLIRAKLAQSYDKTTTRTRYARCSAHERTGYSGISASLAVYNPGILIIDQYSAATMKLQTGPDSIEAGWRVDPQVNPPKDEFEPFGTYLYIGTDAQKVHCFNMLCPGFVVTDKRNPVDTVLDKISRRGGPGYEVDISISRDITTGNWILRVASVVVGFWPSYLFQKPGLAQHVEWGGRVFTPIAQFAMPEMGSGAVVTLDTKRDAYFSFVKVQNGPKSGGKFVDPINLKCEQKCNYIVRDEGNVGPDIEYLIFYGGPMSTL